VPTNSVMDTTSTGRRRNRSWPEALKREIVAASLVPGSSVSVVARRYDVNANQVFAWRKRFHDEPGASATGRLIPVRIAAEQDTLAPKSSAEPETIEIELGCKYRIRVIGDVKAEALRRVLEVLERR
jgi:transposase